MSDPEVFVSYAFEYDRWFEYHQVEYALELKAIKAYLPSQGNGVEIGSGSGRFSRPLGIKLGIEPSEAMRRLALARGVDTVAGTAESLPLAGDSFEYAVFVTTVCYLEEPELAFRETYRVLKPGGCVIVGFIDRDSKLGKRYQERRNKSRFYKDANFRSVVAMQEKLEISGFSNIECIQALLPIDVDKHQEPGIKPGYGEGSFIVMRGYKHDG